ncbi:hypothetical protein [Pedobacter agri]|uniref:hypothetical protein n=1 Tax=Pedobacter agri TaxID=454586 RepID=UPI00292DE6C7|nr:hypothetical protein [Pedobacter agri]
MLRYKIFVIFHDKIIEEYYDSSVLENLVFINVNPNNKYNYPGLNILNLHDLENFIPLGKWYAESEVIYNIKRNDDLIRELDYIGFIHHDIDFKIMTDSYIQEEISRTQLINLQPYSFQVDFNQKILMDEKFPEKLKGQGNNCYLSIFNDFNRFYDTNYNVKDFLGIGVVNLCACFIIRKNLFDSMMQFIDPIIESHRLDRYDTGRKYRIQGGFMERYYATWFMLKKISGINIKLDHFFYETNKQESKLSKILSKVKIFIKKMLVKY